MRNDGDRRASSQLAFARRELVGRALWLLALSVLVGGLVIFGFGWSVRDVAVGTAIGIPLWGSVKFFFEVLHAVPRGALPEVPAGSQVGHRSGGPVAVLGKTTFVLVACVGIAWLADTLAVGAVFAPGQLAGYTCAYVVGALLVARWERGTGQLVLIAGPESDEDEDHPALYAAPAESKPG